MDCSSTEKLVLVSGFVVVNIEFYFFQNVAIGLETDI